MRFLRAAWWVVTDHTERHECDERCREGCPWPFSRREAMHVAWEASNLRSRTLFTMRCGCQRSTLTGRMARYLYGCARHFPRMEGVA
jgi:hypothetical protein